MTCDLKVWSIPPNVLMRTNVINTLNKHWVNIYSLFSANQNSTPNSRPPHTTHVLRSPHWFTLRLVLWCMRDVIMRASFLVTLLTCGSSREDLTCWIFTIGRRPRLRIRNGKKMRTRQLQGSVSARTVCSVCSHDCPWDAESYDRWVRVMCGGLYSAPRL